MMQPYDGVQYITKYFGENVHEYYERGSFRFGTLRFYRDNEATSGTHSDDKDGIREQVIKGDVINEDIVLPNGRVLNNNTFTEAGMSTYNSTKNTPADERVSVRVQLDFNEYVFCSSVGGYDENIHCNILNGKKFSEDGCDYEYPPNSSYTNFAVIDVVEFVNRLSKLGYKTNASRISYTNEVGRFRKQDRGETTTWVGEDATPWLPALFEKPIRFRPEKEYRIAILPPIGSPTENDVKPFCVEDLGLRQAIKKMGHV